MNFKKILVSTVSVSLLLLPRLGSAAFVVELTTNCRMQTNYYWEEGNQIKLYRFGGVVGFSRSLVREIRESARPYHESTADAAGADDATAAGKEVGKETGEVQAKVEPEPAKATSPALTPEQIAVLRQEKKRLNAERAVVSARFVEAKKTGDKEARTAILKEVQVVNNKIETLRQEVMKTHGGTEPDWWNDEN